MPRRQKQGQRRFVVEDSEGCETYRGHNAPDIIEEAKWRIQTRRQDYARAVMIDADGSRDIKLEIRHGFL